MDDVSLVIKIPAELYSLIQNKLDFNGDLKQKDIKTIMLAIDDGIQLPKGHGRLVDADAVLAEPIGNTYKDIDIAETIIEADAPKRRKGTPLEENDSGYNCENWIP